MSDERILNISEQEDELILLSDNETVTEEVTPETTNNEAVEDIALKEEESSRKPFTVMEDVLQRGENVKVFNMSDGTKQAVFYGEPVHVLDEAGEKFVEPDNTLVEDEDGKYFVNAGNRFIARFSKKSNNNELFSMEKGQYRLVISLKKNSRGRNLELVPELKMKRKTAIKAAISETDNDIISVGTNSTKISETVNEQIKTTMLVFAGAAENADFEYEVKDNSVKENIIIKERGTAYRYSFYIDMENLVMDFSEDDRSVFFKSAETGEEIFMIPAPFMEDSKGEYSDGVFYEVKTVEEGRIELSVIADSEWINAEEREFPVMIDPQIVASGSSRFTTYSYTSGIITDSSPTHKVGKTGTSIKHRMYMKVSLPTLPQNPRIKKAELTITQKSGTVSGSCCPKIGLYTVRGILTTGIVTPVEDKLLDYEVMKTGNCKYTFDITPYIDSISKGENSSVNLMFRMADENCGYDSSLEWYGATDGTYTPKMAITYETSYAVNSSYSTHTHEIGKFGTGIIDLNAGNLMFDSTDFEWAGRRMPVIIKHYYNSALSDRVYTQNEAIGLNTADFSVMGTGRGWKLNLMQSIRAKTFVYDSTAYSGFVYTGETGEEVYFKRGTDSKFKKCCCMTNGQCCEYYMFEAVDGSGYTYDDYENKLYKNNQTYLFDKTGKLIKVSDEYNNSMIITYTSGKITSVTDGAGRAFAFNYSSAGMLISVTAPDGTSISYIYNDSNLAQITYPNGQTVKFTYGSSDDYYLPSEVLLKDSCNNNLYKINYTFSKRKLRSVKEYGYENYISVLGQNALYEYSVSARRTMVTATEQADGNEVENVIKTVYCFDDDGNEINKYMYTDETGNVGAGDSGSGINPYSGEGGAKVVSNVDNLLLEHNFDDVCHWKAVSNNLKDFRINAYTNQNYALFGQKVLYMQSDNSGTVENGVYQTTNTLPAGKYTFSVYLRMFTEAEGAGSVTNPGGYIKVTKTNGDLLAISERLIYKDSEFVRLAAPFEISEAQVINVGIYMNGKTTIYADGAQLEKNEYANGYNMLVNNNFEKDFTGWIKTSSGTEVVTDTKFNMSRSVRLTGDLESQRYVYQTVNVKTYTNVRETFTLSGWAKGFAVPDRDRDNAKEALFRLRARIVYSDNSMEDHVAEVSTCTEDWQLVSVQFAKGNYKTVKNIVVYCEYSYNEGFAYFDNIQLIRNRIETGLSVSDFYKNYKTVTDTELSEDTNSKSITFGEVKDTFGNHITETMFKDGEFGSVYRAFKFDSLGNNLTKKIDSRGNNTVYIVDEETSRDKVVTDRCGNKSEYGYNNSGRVTSVIAKDSQNNKLSNVAYEYYNYNNLTKVQRGDNQGYSFKYDRFNKLESIGVSGKNAALVKYSYKNGNGRLKQITYANGDIVYVKYNSKGQVVLETWKNSADNETAKYRYVYDGTGNLVRSIDILNCREYTYYYENGNIIRGTENIVFFDNDGIIISRIIINSILYEYSSDGKVIKKRIQDKEGNEEVYSFENTEEERVIVKLPTGVTSHSKQDHLGRKVFDEIQLGTGFLSRHFSYLTGEVTQEHASNSKLKSSPTTNLVKSVVFTNGRTISYEYDKEERITKVNDSTDGITEYTFDTLGQLTSETINGVRTSFTYDNYGNILAKGSNVYTYGDGVWKDKLTKYNGETITYDEVGNPLIYRGYIFTWEKGRQLKSAVGNGKTISYTYNANGIRTSKTVNGLKHEYVLKGTNILKETYNGVMLDYLYDNETSVCGLKYNGVSYYFYKNLQGDILEIADSSGNTVVKYTYDAWGKVLYITGNAEVGNINPFRYRGYYYDTESGLYYLNSRYYDPVVGRFLNVDALIDLRLIQGLNLFVYCGNNPVNFYDINGYFIGALIGGVIGGIGGAIGGGISAAINGENVLNGVASGALGGAIGGATAGTIVDIFITPGTSIVSAMVIGAVGGSMGGFASSTVSQMSNYYFNNGTLNGFEMDWQSVMVSTLTGAIFNGIGTGVGQDIALTYGDKLLNAISGGFFSFYNAGTDITLSAITANISRMQDKVQEACICIIPNPYQFTCIDMLRLQKIKWRLNGEF